MGTLTQPGRPRTELLGLDGEGLVERRELRRVIDGQRPNAREERLDHAAPML